MEMLSQLRAIDHPEAIASLLRSVFGARASIDDFKVLKTDLDYCVLSVNLNHPHIEVVVKLAGRMAHMSGQFDRTARIHRLVSENTNISMPEIIAVDTSLNHWPWRYIVRTCLPGAEWAYLHNRISASERAGAYRQMGEAVAQLHRIAFPGFGELDPQGLVQNPDQDCLSALIRHASHILQGPRLLDYFLSALELRADRFGGLVESRLCHEDLHRHNFLFFKRGGEWRLATILDFDKVWAGPAEADLARMELWKGMTSLEFWEAYRCLNPVDADYLYRRPLYQLLWCLEYARSTPEHLGDTQRLCQEMGIPVIKTFD